MVAQTRAMEIVTTTSEAEALLLEAQLIKRYRPPYNVLLRDDKSFPFILLRMDHDFPRVQKHRGARRGKGRYYGPFASAGSVNRTLNALQKTFLLRSCTDSFFANRSRPCLLYQIRRCRSEEHTSELQSLMRISYSAFCWKKNKQYNQTTFTTTPTNICLTI